MIKRFNNFLSEVLEKHILDEKIEADR